MSPFSTCSLVLEVAGAERMAMRCLHSESKQASRKAVARLSLVAVYHKCLRPLAFIAL